MTRRPRRRPAREPAALRQDLTLALLAFILIRERDWPADLRTDPDELVRVLRGTDE